MSIFNFYQNIHVHIAYYHCAKDQIKNRTPAVLFLKRRLLKIAKPPVLQTCGNDSPKSRYGNDLKFVMAFLDRSLFHLSEGFSFNYIKKKY